MTDKDIKELAEALRFLRVVAEANEDFKNRKQGGTK